MPNKDPERSSTRMHLFNTSLFDMQGKLDWRKILGKTVLLMAFFLVVYAIGLYFTRDVYQEIGAWVASVPGYPGVGLFVFIVDMLIVPMTVDLLFPFVLDWNPVALILTFGFASALGGYCGYWIGRLLGKWKFLRQFTDAFSKDGERMINLYGVWAVVIAGLTPIPYSTVCWLTGMLRVKHWEVALASLSRIPRMAIYFLIFKGGLSFILS